MRRRPFAVLVCAALVAWPASAPAAAVSSGNWAIQPVPQLHVRTGGFSDISCTGASDCVAVGSSVDATTQPLVEILAGGVWSIVGVPLPAGAQGGSLSAVSCSGPAQCIAVGTWFEAGGAAHALAESGTGGTWTASSPPAPAGAATTTLSDVSCAAPSACLAIGRSYQSGNGSGDALAESWDGAGWTIVATPNPRTSRLAAVSCVAPAACTAVGFTDPGSGTTAALAEAWNGSSWAVSAPPVPRGTPGSALSGLSCTTASACLAVGSFQLAGHVARNLAERWDGTGWSRVIDPVPANNTSLLAVSCSAATRCAVTGSHDLSDGRSLAFTGSWDGTTWTVEAPQAPSSPAHTQLPGLSCPGPDSCYAAGTRVIGGVDKTVVEVRDSTGGWTVAATPNPIGAESGELAGVSCSGPACVAVGTNHASGGADAALALTRSGGRWAIAPVPRAPGGTDTSLTAVSCTAAANCLAVGAATTADGASEPLADGDDGGAWTTTSPPLPADAAGGSLSAVSCTSATACVAVGSVDTVDGAARPLAESWDGVQWSASEPPSADGRVDSVLNGLDCTSATACVAVGENTASTFGNDSRTQIDTWDGATWTLTPSPDASTADVLSAVSCSSPTACIAVGTSDATGAARRALALRWDGTAWAVTPTSDGTAPGTGLFGVSCAAADDCITVGTGFGTDGYDTTQAEHWDGTTWTLSTTRDAPDEVGSALLGVSCPAAGSCTAVGNAYVPGQHPLVEATT